MENWGKVDGITFENCWMYLPTKKMFDFEILQERGLYGFPLLFFFF